MAISGLKKHLRATWAEAPSDMACSFTGSTATGRFIRRGLINMSKLATGTTITEHVWMNQHCLTYHIPAGEIKVGLKKVSCWSKGSLTTLYPQLLYGMRSHKLKK